MIRAISLALVAVLLACPPAEATHKHTPAATAGKFDYYVLSLSWAPKYCESHPDDASECGATPQGFVLHGLWPEFNSGSYPQECSAQSQLDEAARAYGKTIYPSESLVAHEWQKHGTCSGLSPHDYFQAADTARKSIVIPEAFTPGQRRAGMKAAAISKSIRQSNPQITNQGLAVLCVGGELSELRICMSKDLKPISCGNGVRSSCKNGTIGIPGVR